MKNLWAPWRMEYVVKDKSKDCIFCTLPKDKNDRATKILFRANECFAIMNIFPYNNGHIMVSPYRHISCITKLSEEEFSETNRLVQKSLEKIRTVYNPDGFNVGCNIGKVAGAGYDDHIHVHIVPRWTGDTNYMPVLADIKVHPEHLESTYDRLYPEFQKISL